MVIPGESVRRKSSDITNLRGPMHEPFTQSRPRRRTRRLINIAAGLICATALFGTSTPSATAEDLPEELAGLPIAERVIQQLRHVEAPVDITTLGPLDGLGPPPWISTIPNRDPLEIAAWELLAANTFDGANDVTNARDRAAIEVYFEREPSFESGFNESPLSGELLLGIGTGASDSGQVRIQGTVPRIDQYSCPSDREDDGSIPLAFRLGLGVNSFANCTGFIGDGPFGSSSGDHDFFDLGRFEIGDQAALSIQPSGTLEPFLLIYNEFGSIVEGVGSYREISFTYTAQAAGRYFLEVTDAETFLTDPFDSSSGIGATGTGSYDLSIRRPSADVDTFLIEAEAGDVIAAGFESSMNVSIIRPDNVVAKETERDLSLIYPLGSPIRGIKGTNVDHVAATTGTYAIQVSGGLSSSYAGEIRVVRPGLSNAPGTDTQIIFLDFDGATIDRQIFEPFGRQGSLTLTPLADFLSRWGLDRSTEDEVIDTVVNSFGYRLHVLATTGGNGDRDATNHPGEFDVEIRNSRDHGDLWGQPNVTRIIVGGTQDQLGRSVIGLAQSLDPGNLDTEETGVVLLDILSNPAEDDPLNSINAVALAPGASKTHLVGSSIATVAVHEIGHLLGNWHTDEFNEVGSVMDTRSSPNDRSGAGIDEVFGTADDRQVGFVTDRLERGRDFGFQNAAARSAFGMSTGQTAPRPGPGGAGLPADGDIIVLRNVDTGRYLDADGADQHYNADTSAAVSGDDKWLVADAGDGAVYLINQAFHRYLDADPDGGVETSEHPAADDRWIVTGLADGSVHIFNVEYQQYLDADGAENHYEAELSAQPARDDQWMIEIVSQSSRP